MGAVGVARAELPPLPDDILTNPGAGRVDPRRWFTDPARRFEIEIGFGKGGFILQHATAQPDANVLGIEYAREFYMYGADRVRRRGLGNVRMLHADAVDFLTWRCPDAIVRTIHLYYSDPWPKAKHHKNRVVQHRSLAEMWRVLAPGGELRVVTDHDELWAWCRRHFDLWTGPGLATAGDVPEAVRSRFSTGAPAFVERAFEPPTWAEEGEVVGTNYERKFTSEGKPPHACVLMKS